MGHPSEAGFHQSPTTSQSHMDVSPVTESPVDGWSEASLNQTPRYAGPPDTPLQSGNSWPEQSRGLSNQRSQSTTGSVKSSWSRFAVATKNDSLSSGFPFHHRLYDLKVTHDQWFLFTNDVVNAAKMSPKEDYLAWTTGITAGTLTAPFLFVLSPVVGYYSGKAVHKKTLVKTVTEKLGQEGGLRDVLKRWNEQTFMQKGFQAWLELPRDSDELHKELHIEDSLNDKEPKNQKKAAKKAARRFRILIIPNDDVDAVPVPPAWSSTSIGSSSQSVVRAPMQAEDSVAAGLPPAYSDVDAARHTAMPPGDTTNHSNSSWVRGYSKT